MPVPRLPLMSKFGVRFATSSSVSTPLSSIVSARERGDRDRRVLQRRLATLGRDDDLLERGTLSEDGRRAADQCCDGRCHMAATTNELPMLAPPHHLWTRLPPRGRRCRRTIPCARSPLSRSRRCHRRRCDSGCPRNTRTPARSSPPARAHSASPSTRALESDRIVERYGDFEEIRRHLCHAHRDRQLLAVRNTGRVDQRVVAQTARVRDERVAFPTPDRVTV